MTSDNLVSLVKKFKGLQNEFVDFGALDTEPRFIFRHFLSNISKLNPPTSWDLYDNSMDTNEANQELTKCATLIKELYSKLHYSEKAKFDSYVEESL